MIIKINCKQFQKIIHSFERHKFNKIRQISNQFLFTLITDAEIIYIYIYMCVCVRERERERERVRVLYFTLLRILFLLLI